MVWFWWFCGFDVLVCIWSGCKFVGFCDLGFVGVACVGFVYCWLGVFRLLLWVVVFVVTCCLWVVMLWSLLVVGFGWLVVVWCFTGMLGCFYNGSSRRFIVGLDFVVAVRLGVVCVWFAGFEVVFMFGAGLCLGGLRWVVQVGVLDFGSGCWIVLDFFLVTCGWLWWVIALVVCLGCTVSCVFCVFG